MKSKPHVLVVDDEINLRRVLCAQLSQAGWETGQAGSGEEALERVRQEDPDLVLTDLRMPGMDGLELLARLRRDFPEVPVVMLTAFGSIDTAVEAMKRGAFDFLTKPFDKDKVVQTIHKALAQAEHGRREFQGPWAAEAPCGIVGHSPAIARVRALIERLAPSRSTVLVTGETGTGKELVAEALHRLSPRSAAPLVRLNCAALPESLVEAELFGHERGAFTGAEKARPGRFELADEGTLFLDEIGELSLAIQAKLLRVLEDGRVDRLGATAPLEVDLRLVAATHRNLEAEVQAGRFRQDLLFRLKVVEIRVPSLAERTADIPELVEFFIEQHARRLGRPRPGLDPGVGPALQARAWPGNVRELENAVERALLLGEGPVLLPQDFLPGESTLPLPGASLVAPGIKSASRSAAAQAEKHLIVSALEESRGNVTRAAAALGLSRRGLQLKLKSLGLR